VQAGTSSSREERWHCEAICRTGVNLFKTVCAAIKKKQLPWQACMLWMGCIRQCTPGRTKTSYKNLDRGAAGQHKRRVGNRMADMVAIQGATKIPQPQTPDSHAQRSCACGLSIIPEKCANILLPKHVNNPVRCHAAQTFLKPL
jgi:hypothetical protein